MYYISSFSLINIINNVQGNQELKCKSFVDITPLEVFI